MTEQLVEAPEVTVEDLRRRIDDWTVRLSKLYSDVEEWVGQLGTYTTRRVRNVRMYEELMEQFSLDAEMLDSLDVRKGSDLVMTLRPVGLWTIGANGRVDLLFRTGSVILVDRAKPFHPPQWTAFSLENKKNGEPFTQSTMLRMLRNYE